MGLALAAPVRYVALLAVMTAAPLGLATGCGGSEDSSSSTTAPASTSTADETTTTRVETTTAGSSATPHEATGAAQPYFSIDEIVLGPNGYVTLTNFTESSESLAGLEMCQGSSCEQLPSIMVPGSDQARIGVGNGDGVKDIAATHAKIGALKASDGEIAIYAKNSDGERQLVSFVEWGSSPHAHTEEAINAGLWLKDSFAPTSAQAVRLYRKASGLWLFDAR
jgi:hypothetical protein